MAQGVISAERRAASEEDPNRVRRSVMWAYAAPSLAAGFTFTLVIVYATKYAADVVGIPLDLAGYLLGFGRLWDALTDPYIGHVSDRLRWRIGRRRGLVVASGLPFALAFWWIWSPAPGELAPIHMGAAVFLFFTAGTVLTVPHMAWGADLTSSHHERTRIFGISNASMYSGSFVAMLAMFWATRSGDVAGSFQLLGLVGGAMTMVLVVAVPLGIPDDPAPGTSPGGSVLGTYLDVLRDPPARTLVLITAAVNLSTGLATVLTPFFAAYILGDESVVGFLLIASIVPSVLVIPAVVRFSAAVGKRPTTRLVMLTSALGYLLMLTLGATGVVVASVAAFLIGAGNAGSRVMIMSLVADAAGSHRSADGRSRDGAYFALMVFIRKIMLGVAILGSTRILDLLGYVQNVPQTQTVQVAMLLLYSALPLAVTILGLLATRRLPTGPGRTPPR